MFFSFCFSLCFHQVWKVITRSSAALHQESAGYFRGNYFCCFRFLNSFREASTPKACLLSRWGRVGQHKTTIHLHDELSYLLLVRLVRANTRIGAAVGVPARLADNKWFFNTRQDNKWANGSMFLTQRIFSIWLPGSEAKTSKTVTTTTRMRTRPLLMFTWFVGSFVWPPKLRSEKSSKLKFSSKLTFGLTFSYSFWRCELSKADVLHGHTRQIVPFSPANIALQVEIRMTNFAT